MSARGFILDAVVDALRHDAARPVYGIDVTRNSERRVVAASVEPGAGLIRLGPAEQSAGTWWIMLDREHIELTVLPYRHDYLARHAGIVEPSILAGKRAGIVGLGSVGLPIALFLARAGTQVTALDNDTVALENLTRTGFSIDQLGMPKVEAAAELLMHANPGLDIRPYKQTLHEFETEGPGFGADHDLVICCASNAAGFELAARHHRQIPMLFPALHPMAASGEVFLSLGSRDAERACFTCFRERLHQDAPTPPSHAWNYGSDGELQAQPGLGADIATVVAVTAGMAIRILAGTVDEVLDGRQLLLLSNRRDALFHDAWATGWFDVDRDPECPNHADTVAPNVIDIPDLPEVAP